MPPQVSNPSVQNFNEPDAAAMHAEGIDPAKLNRQMVSLREFNDGKVTLPLAGLLGRWPFSVTQLLEFVCLALFDHQEQIRSYVDSCLEEDMFHRDKTLSLAQALVIAEHIATLVNGGEIGIDEGSDKRTSIQAWCDDVAVEITKPDLTYHRVMKELRAQVREDRKAQAQ